MDKQKNRSILCSQVAKEGFERVDDAKSRMFEFLSLKTDTDANENSFVCLDCMELAEKSFQFISHCVYTEDIILSYSAITPNGMVNLSNVLKMKGSVCRFCLTEVKVFESLDVLKRELFGEMVPGCMKEIDFDIVRNAIICISCKQSLESYLRLLHKTGGFDKKIIAEDITVKEEIVDEVKIEIHELPYIVKNEVLDATEEELHQAEILDREQKHHEDGVEDNTALKSLCCKLCGFVMIEKDHSSQSEEDQSRDKRGMNNHMVRHVNPGKIFNCPKCCFKFKRNGALSNHMLTHKYKTDVMYRCNVCKWTTKWKQSTQNHLLTHNSGAYMETVNPPIEMALERRTLTDQENEFQLPDDGFLREYKLPKHLVHDIIGQLQEHGECHRGMSIPFHLRVLVTLNFLGQGTSRRDLVLRFGSCMTSSSIGKTVINVCKLITQHLLPKWVKFPVETDSMDVTKKGFYEKWGMRGIIGVLDGTHVQFPRTPVYGLKYHPTVYRNKEERYSISVMLICDADQRLLAVDASFPGSVSDAAIFRASDVRNSLKTKYANGLRGSYLIGDSDYGVEPWLLTPYFKATPDSREERFNRLLNTTRNVIESTKGVWKTRFRCLSKIFYCPSNVSYIIYACAVLHNMAIEANVSLVEDPDEYVFHEDVPMNLPIYDEKNDIGEMGMRVRNEYVANNVL